MKVIIIGGGQVGSYLASLLLAHNHEVRVIENRERVFNKLEKELPQEVLIFGSGSDPALLEKAGIDSADVVAAVSGADEVNLVVSTLAKMEFGVSKVVARVNNPKNAWLFNSGMGVDVGVNQADLMAHFVVEEMNMKDMFTIMKMKRGNCAIVQLQVHQDGKSVNKMLKDLQIPKGMLIIAILRGESLIIPKGDTQILADDDILAITNDDGRERLEEVLN
jgi:trk system potassium uptake protein TrkA